MYNYNTYTTVYENRFGGNAGVSSWRVVYLDFWQFWWWFWFILLFICYFKFFFKGLESLNTLKNNRVVTSLLSCGRLGDYFIALFPISWCLMILTNSNALFTMVDWKVGSTDWTLRIYGKQWYWLYKLSINLQTLEMLSSKITFDNFYSLGIQKPNLLAKTPKHYINLLTIVTGNSWKIPYLSYIFSSKIFGLFTNTPNFNIQQLVVKLRQNNFIFFNTYTGLLEKYYLASIGAKKTSINTVLIQKRKSFFLTPVLIMESLKTSRYSLGLFYDFYQASLNNNFNQSRLLIAEKQLILPIHTFITLITTSFDVIHSWFIPGLGIKFDCVPGRMTQHFILFNIRGYYTGQCAEICGRNHHHMPINLVIT